MNNFPSWADHILAILFGLIIPFVSGYRSTKGLNNAVFDSDTKKKLYRVNSFSMAMLALIIIAVWFLYSRPWSGLGFTYAIGYGTTVTLLVVIFIVLYAADTMYAISTAANRQQTIDQWQTATPFLPTLKNELPLYFVMCVTAGVGEEIVFRGFLVTYCLYLFSGNENAEWWAVLLPSLVFSISHYYQGSRAVFKIFILSVLFGFIFLKSGSLWIVMILHFLVDALGGILSIWLISKRKNLNYNA
jgi:membrane protease YdiL (CAAX protease family)